VELGAFGGRCVVYRGDGWNRERLGALQLSIPGRHNLQNALAAVAVADRLGIDFSHVASALADFRGAERRFERCGEAGGVLVVDDYGHHPTEIAAVLAAARATLGRRLVVAFQPHRYTRTQRLMGAFGPALREADEIVDPTSTPPAKTQFRCHDRRPCRGHPDRFGPFVRVVKSRTTSFPPSWRLPDPRTRSSRWVQAPLDRCPRGSSRR
jgi:hypothetical protein